MQEHVCSNSINKSATTRVALCFHKTSNTSQFKTSVSFISYPEKISFGNPCHVEFFRIASCYLSYFAISFQLRF